jgi:hypothetical protein
VFGIRHVADSAFDFDADHKCRDEIAAGDRSILGKRQDRGQDRRRWMNDGLRVRVVKIQHV